MATRFLSPYRGGRRLLSRSDPFFELQRELNRLLDDAFQTSSGQAGAIMAAPSIDIHETDDAIEVNAELPGVSEKDIDLRLEGDVLTIVGEKRNERKDEQAHLVECSYGSFQRAIQLPFNPNPDEVKADLKNGVLKVRLPRGAEQDRRRRIEIGSGSSARSGGESGQQQGSPGGGEPAIGQNWSAPEDEPDLDKSKEERGQGAPA